MKPRQVATAVGMGTLALALAGCMKVDMALELNNDDTVDGTMIMAFEKSLSSMMGDEFDTMLDGMLSESTGDLPENTTSEPYEDDTYQGAEYTFTDAPLDEFSDSDMSITHEDGEWEFTGTAAMTEEELGGGAEDLEGLGDFGDMSEMMEMEVRISITFPGEVLETNGTVDGTTVTWSPEFGEVADMHARASETGGGGDGLPAWLWILIGVVVLAALVGGLFYFSRGRNAPAGAPAEDAAAPADVPPPPSAPVAETTDSQASASAGSTDATGTPEPPGTEPPNQPPR